MKSGDISLAIEEKIKKFFAENSGKALRPFAYFDKHLDCIRVQIQDCSFKEIRLNERCTILQANHSPEIEYVGFTLKGIKYLTKNLGLPENEPVLLAGLIDAIVKQSPEICIDFIQANFDRQMLEKIEVEEYPLDMAA